jgi:hypothetical protein
LTAARRRRTRLVGLALSALVLADAAPSGAQDLGHKALGTLGLGAGVQPERGLYFADRFLYYRADQVVDRDGRRIPVDIDLDAVANGFGIGGTIELPWPSTYLNASIGVPVAHVTLQTDRSEVGIDRFGLGDLYVQPVKLGWKLPRFDLVAGYAFYAPTGRFEPGSNEGVGSGQWTHEFSLGGTAYLDPAKTWKLSALASYDLNLRKRDIDITRGDTVQVQGGASATLFGLLEVGLAGYALWQVRDDRGADVPLPLRGARDRAYGLGPEIVLAIAPLRSRLSVRYEWDVAVRSRPRGQILVIGLTILAVP